MTELSTNLSTQSQFDSIKHINGKGEEFWYGRELMKALGYGKYWENFEKVISKAKDACSLSNGNIYEHFRDVTKEHKVLNQHGTYIREKNDIVLTRYACYLIAQNGDSRKSEIALAQTYFAFQTHRQEIEDRYKSDKKRLLARAQTAKATNILKETAQKAGVTHFGTFMDEGYMGLYGGLRLRDIKKLKKVDGNYLDFIGIAELSYNLFKTTLTDEQLKGVYGEEKSKDVHHKVGNEVRKTIEKLRGTLPEDLPTEKNIKEVEKNVKKMDFIKNRGIPMLPI